MAVETTYIGQAKPYCREHGLMTFYDEALNVYKCTICGVGASLEEVNKN